MKTGLDPAPVVRNARQERQDCAKDARADKKTIYYPVIGILGVLGAVLAYLARI
jgi:hypothetical protein